MMKQKTRKIASEIGMHGCLLVVFLCVLHRAPVRAQPADPALPDDPMELDRSQWHELSASLDYPVIEVPEQKPPERRGPLLGEAAYGVMRVVLIGVAAVLLALLLRAIILANWQARDHKLKGALTVSELDRLEDRLEEADLRTPLERAVQEGQYELAVRLCYLSALQALSRQQWIRWKKEKTNMEYQAELADTPFAEAFPRLTRIFEQVWYGGLRVTPEQFERIHPQFKALQTQIEQTPKPAEKP